ncbi:type I-E CRISPR-associated protein Cse1/CasA [Nocardiopsis sp. MG754419]|uniref:type I-E CRISPR-associated protein Cse1/CasA n=1 Tax=Nocardiopsis sp. MG754419 TaxID=2259865 RepID=UPI001BA91F68|nr:type I-E CRISPR-associated protein Cse1/CasA [Nocardiopsis sp. MG754419]MBR8740171.1 type I-E CRISPR-associated protein Cse1/CasA [Nocardiopsis sp. MG754419]
MPNEASTAVATPDSATSPPPHFDLTRRPWIPVLRTDGVETELSLIEVFEQAAQVRRLVGDLPTQDFALLRLLLAILHDAIDGPRSIEDWGELWDDGLPLEETRAYLDTHRERFDLLHPDTPFMQVSGLRTAKGEYSALDRIVADVPNGARFFTMRADGARRLDHGEAARWLVHAHAYDLSGIKSGAEGDPRVKGGRGYPQGVGWAGHLGGVYAEGDDLRQTLLLNLIAFDTKNFDTDAGPEPDRPAWVHPPATAAPLSGAAAGSRPYGVRDLYTWQTRRVRLQHDAEGVHGVLLAYGDPLSPRNMQLREPMSAWRRSPAQEKKLREATVYLPRDHDPARAAWRGLGALVTGRVRGGDQRQEAAEYVRPRIVDWIARLTVHRYLPRGHLLRVRLAGAVYGTQQSVVDEIVDDSVAMPMILLHQEHEELAREAVDAVTDAEDAVTALGDLATGLAQAAGADGDGPRGTARDRGFGELDEPFRDWLRRLAQGGGEDTGTGLPLDDPRYPREQRRTWQFTVRSIVSRLADELIASASEASWEGRVLETKSGAFWLNTSSVDLRFRRALRTALPLTIPDTDSDNGTEEQQ